MYNTGPFFEEDGVELEGSINYHHKKQTPLMTRNPRKVLTSILTFSIFNILIGAGVMGTQVALVSIKIITWMIFVFYLIDATK